MSASETIISVENLSKRYRLGVIGATTLRDSVERWWHKARGRQPADHMGVVGEKAARRERNAEILKDPGPGTKDENALWALRDVSFEVQSGEVLGIIGRNGAGKSTLLKILSRITEPTSGRAVLRGRVGSLLEVGTGFHPELTGRENVYLNGAILGMRRAEISAKFDEIVAFSEVGRFIDTPVKRYSSGMKVRLAFAVAAHLDPEILLVDEVLAVGDAAFQKKCLGKMGAVAAEGRTVLFVSHNMGAMEKLCRRVVLLERGALVQDGAASEVIAGYLEHQVKLKNVAMVDHPRLGEMGAKVKIVDAYVKNANDEKTAQLRYGEPFSVGIALRSRNDIDELDVQVRIDTLTGTPITHALSSYANCCFSIAAGRQLTLEARMSGLLLFPGKYALTLGVRKYDQVQQGFVFEVLPVTYSADIAPHMGEWGFMRWDAEWSVVNL